MEKLQCYFHFSFPLLVTRAASEALSLCTLSWGCKTKSVLHTPSHEAVWGKEPPDTLWDFSLLLFLLLFNSISAITSALAECKALPLQKLTVAGLRFYPFRRKMLLDSSLESRGSYVQGWHWQKELALTVPWSCIMNEMFNRREDVGLAKPIS